MPESNPPEITLVIPAYREAGRLPPFLEVLGSAIEEAGLAERLRVVVVDDGSPPDESRAMDAAVGRLRANHRFIAPMRREPHNLGKGGTVYAGWDHEDAGARWLGFVDADGAASAAETVRLLGQVLAIPGGRDPLPAVYAVRYPAPENQVRRSALRGLLGRVFSLITFVLFRFPLRDTQCGLKFVPAAAYRAIRPKLTEMRFCFDIELTHRLLESGTPVRTVPISWHESPGSKLSPGSAVRMFRSLLRLRRDLPPLRP